MPPTTQEFLRAFDEFVQRQVQRQALEGPDGYGTPRRIRGYQIVGHAKGRLKNVFDINAHPGVIGGQEDDVQSRNFNYGAMSVRFWNEFFARWMALKEENNLWLWINTWFPKPGVMVVVYKGAGEKYVHFVLHRWDRSYELLMRTNKVVLKTASVAAEKKARKELLTRLNREQRRQLTLTNSFVEIGKSAVRYLVRHGRPTVAYREEKVEPGVEKTEFLAGLCLHPFGYYRRTYAGIMVPSDEMLAHLLLIRSGEHGFWRRAEQHPIDSATAGF
ncbi:MAG: hypothetical protein Q8P13_02685 [bacterium]|nr:hypothetical protein [bacterium]